MKKILATILLMIIYVTILPNSVSAGKPLNGCTSYKEFAGSHHGAVKAMFNGQQKSIADHKIEMVYPETAKKAMRMQGLGLEYTKGELFFLEVPNKNDGVYVSFNENGFLDAIVIEVNKNRHSAVMFTMNEILVSMVCLLILPSSKIDQNIFLDVINGTKAYIDVHCKNHNGEAFYLRIKDVHDSGHPFYRIAMFRL